jgi:hypothetical protein
MFLRVFASICEEAGMPKNILIELKGLSGDFDDTTGPNSIAIGGEIFGFTSDADGTLEARTDIFTFPNGPLTIRNGQTTHVAAEAIYTLMNPSQDGPGGPTQLSFGGRLTRADGQMFGENLRSVTTFSPTPEGSRDTIVRVVSGNQEIKLHFFLTVTTSS